ncbi:MAG: methyltransferase [Bacteroidales bacterium]|nr:methyltransferase [Bacteroidales bacterium]
MTGNSFTFKQFAIYQENCAFKVGTDGVLLGAAADVTDSGSILDIGTGTGLIAIMLAQRTTAEIFAIEPDPSSYSQACSNAAMSPWADRIKIFRTTLQDFDPGSRKFDLIVSNPPFFSDSLKNPDPVKALARHNDSLSGKELLSGSKRLLAKGGRLEIIMPYVEGSILVAEAPEYDLYCNRIIKIRPLPTSEVRRLILTFSGEKTPLHESWLTIEHGKRHEFTDAYKNLTRDFYLKF